MFWFRRLRRCDFPTWVWELFRTSWDIKNKRQSASVILTSFILHQHLISKRYYQAISALWNNAHSLSVLIWYHQTRCKCHHFSRHYLEKSPRRNYGCPRGKSCLNIRFFFFFLNFFLQCRAYFGFYGPSQQLHPMWNHSNTQSLAIGKNNRPTATARRGSETGWKITTQLPNP